MKLENIGFYTLSEWRAKHATESSPLWRCELLLTNKCNFNCPYCRGLSGKELLFDDAKSILDIWIDGGLQHVRFSGGEPTLYPDLDYLIQQCENSGVKRIAISTNGSAELDYYLWLMQCGVNDFSISLDACCSSDANVMSGSYGKWDNVVSNIKALSKEIYVTVGIVYNELNQKSIVDTIQFAHKLGVADIRVIPSAQFGNKMSFYINQEILDYHPILKYRLAGHRNVRGISEYDCNKCKLVLDDMAIWNGYHYPCIIYLRERGDPIGKVSRNMRSERLEWYKTHDSYTDPICKINCLDVCVEYNNHADKYSKNECCVL